MTFYLLYNLQKEVISCQDGWGLSNNGSSLNVKRCSTNLTGVFISQVTQSLPVTCSRGIVSIVPLGPANFRNKGRHRDVETIFFLQNKYFPTQWKKTGNYFLISNFMLCILHTELLYLFYRQQGDS